MQNKIPKLYQCILAGLRIRRRVMRVILLYRVWAEGDSVNAEFHKTLTQRLSQSPASAML